MRSEFDFRWTSGDPIKTDVSHADAASLKNLPFLRDPEILSLTAGHDWLGPNATIKLGLTAAKYLRTRSSSHLRQQMLVMLGDTVIVAAMVRSPIGETFVLNLPDKERVGRVVDMLRKQRCGGVERARSTTLTQSG